MLNSVKFKNSIKALIVATKTTDFSSEQMEVYYSVLKDDFTDQEFQETCLALIKICTFFPVVADFYKHKPKLKVPDVGGLIYEWHEAMKGRRIADESTRWIGQILNYYEGSRLYGQAFREMTEKQWDYMQRDFGKAYNAFCKDYQNGSNVRIDYKEIPHITESINRVEDKQGQKKIGDLLKDYGVELKQNKGESLKLSDIF